MRKPEHELECVYSNHLVIEAIFAYIANFGAYSFWYHSLWNPTLVYEHPALKCDCVLKLYYGACEQIPSRLY